MDSAVPHTRRRRSGVVVPEREIGRRELEARLMAITDRPLDRQAPAPGKA